MSSVFILKSLRAGVLGLALLDSAAHATPLMDMRSDDLIMMAAELKKSLQLNANQQILWQQTESRSKTLLRERQARRERLQAATRQSLDGKDVELRELGSTIDSEAATAAAEDKQLREWWLQLNDALDDNQRRAVATFLSEQLQRQPDAAPRAAGPKADGGEHRSGHHRDSRPARPGS